MGPEDQSAPQNGEPQLAAEIAALSARVVALEDEVARLRRTGAVKRSKATPPPPMPVPASTAGGAVPRISLENRIGSQLFSRIGIIALLIGATWFLKLAMDNHWIGPLGRVLAGLIAGTGLVVWSERFRRQGSMRSPGR